MIFEGNQACVKWTKDGGKRTKYIDVRHHILRDAVRNQQIDSKYFPTKYMIADAFTKPLEPNDFAYLTQIMQIVNGRKGQYQMETCFDEAEC